jgi:hypothetical protein
MEHHPMNALRALLAPAAKASSEPAPVSEGRLPSLSRISPAFAIAEQRHNGLLDRQRALQVERKSLLEIVVPGADSPTTDPREDRIARMAGVEPPVRHVGERQRLAEVDQELEDIRHAIDISRPLLMQERIAASRLLCEAIAGRHRELLLELTKHLSAAFTAWQDYTTLLDELRNGQVAYASLRPQTPDFLGRHPNAADGDLRLWLRDVAKAGFIERAELPEGCR